MKLKYNFRHTIFSNNATLLSLVLVFMLLGACHSIKKSDSASQQRQQLSTPTSSPYPHTHSSIADKEGMTLKGVVSAHGKGLEGVVVSDGYEVTTTNGKGVYYLPSKKKNGYVFISVPGNYEVENDERLPQFFKRLEGGNKVEQKDFTLTTQYYLIRRSLTDNTHS